MKALEFKKNGETSNIVDSEKLGYKKLKERLPKGVTEVIETTVSEIKANRPVEQESEDKIKDRLYKEWKANKKQQLFENRRS